MGKKNIYVYISLNMGMPDYCVASLIYSVHKKYGNSKLSYWYPKYVALFMTYLISGYRQYC